MSNASRPPARSRAGSTGGRKPSGGSLNDALSLMNAAVTLAPVATAAWGWANKEDRLVNFVRAAFQRQPPEPPQA